MQAALEKVVSQIKAWEPQADGPGGYADEAALVAGLRAGSQEAFEALHGAYAASIYGLALRIVDDPHEAQDVAQEVLIKVFRALPGKETDLNLPAWLYRVTVNAAFDQVRARKRRPVTVVDDAAPESAAVVDEFERAELSRRVETTLRELPKRQQLALVLRDVHGLSVGETASVLGLTKGSADVLLSRARAGFRRIFLTGAGSLRGRCHEADIALAAGVGRGEGVPAGLLDHSRTCPECRRAVEFWGAAPVGLALLMPQVVLPAKLSLGATLAAAQAAGVAVSGATVAPAAGASVAGGAAAGASTAAGAAAGGTAAAASAGGLLAGLGSAASIKIATLAVVATAALGVTGAATYHESAQPGPADTSTVALSQGDHGAGAGRAGGTGSQAAARARRLARAHRDGRAAHDGANGRAAAVSGSAGRGARGDAARTSSTGVGSRPGGSSGGRSGSLAGSGQASGGTGSGAGADSSTGGGSGSGAGGQGGENAGGTGGSGGETAGGTGGTGGDAAGGTGGGLGGGTFSPQ